MTDRQENASPQELWWIVFAIVLGSVVLGALLPVFLVVAACGAIAIPILAIRDLRLYKKVQRELLEQREISENERQRSLLRRSVIDAADIPILTTDPDGVLQKVNTRAGAVLGMREAMLGRRFDELFTQEVQIGRAHV